MNGLRNRRDTIELWQIRTSKSNAKSTRPLTHHQAQQTCSGAEKANDVTGLLPCTVVSFQATFATRTKKKDRYERRGDDAQS